MVIEAMHRILISCLIAVRSAHVVARSSYGLIFFKVILVAGAKQVGRTTMPKRLAESDINLQAFFEFDIYEQMA